MAFDPPEGLRKQSAYKATPGSEEEAREQIQGRFDEIRDYINNRLVAMLEASTGISGADGIGSAAIGGLEEGETIDLTVRSQIIRLKQQLDARVAELNSAITGEIFGTVDVVSLIGDGDIGGNLIAQGAVVTGHLADEAVTLGKLAAEVLTSLSVADGALTGGKLMDAGTLIPGVDGGDDTVYEGITGAKLKAGTITETLLANNAVGTAKIQDANITAAKIASGAVTTDKLKDAHVTEAKLDAALQAKLAAERTRKINVSSSSPSGGSSGDLWLKYA